MRRSSKIGNVIIEYVHPVPPCERRMWISVHTLDDVLRCCMASNIRTGEYSQLSRLYAFFKV